MGDYVKGLREVQRGDILCPLMELLHHRRPVGWSGRTCPFWSHACCPESPPCPPHASAKLAGGSVPRSPWAQRWGWQGSGSQGPPFYLVRRWVQCFPFPVNFLLPTRKRKKAVLGSFFTCSIRRILNKKNYYYKEEPGLIPTIQSAPEPALNI